MSEDVYNQLDQVATIYIYIYNIYIRIKRVLVILIERRATSSVPFYITHLPLLRGIVDNRLCVNRLCNVSRLYIIRSYTLKL